MQNLKSVNQPWDQENESVLSLFLHPFNILDSDGFPRTPNDAAETLLGASS